MSSRYSSALRSAADGVEVVGADALQDAELAGPVILASDAMRALGRHGDYFSFLGVQRKLNLDAAELEQRFRTLSRQFHPDYFYNATPAERRASLDRSSYLNNAYRTLKQPISAKLSRELDELKTKTETPALVGGAQ